MTLRKKLKLRKEVIFGIVVVIIIIFGVIYMSDDKVKKGNVIKVNYIGSLEDGVIFDTNIEEVANENKLERQLFEPLEFEVGSGQVIKGFDEGVIGMSIGETKKIIVKEGDGYIFNEALVIKNIPFDFVVDRFLELDGNSFWGLFGQSPKEGEIISSKLPFKIKVISNEKDKIKIENLLEIGSLIILPGTSWESKVISLTNDIYTVRHNPKVGDAYIIPQGSNIIVGKVVVVNENSFDVDTNSPLAGKKLIFDVALLEIKE